jgi:murein DD-endopeptidase MepM/ murein hydrolase activator NlpD
MTAEVMTALGDSFTENYDDSVQYGFWVPPELYQENGDLRQSAWDNIDTFDGARLTVTVTFADGSEQSKTYTLSTGKLQMEYDEDGTIHVLPQLAGDEEPCVYGVYAVDESESRWFQWPVADWKVIAFSTPYGEVNGVSHPGIDIAASAGSVITAAADGTVKETGFSTEDGNYLILDHGDGLETKYAHCQEVTVSQGDQVSAGEEIATVGSTGQSTGSHLCFQVWQDGEAQNPVAYFDSDIRDTLSME